MSVMDLVVGPDTPLTRGCIVKIIAGKDFGCIGEVISINKLAGGDHPRELFVIRNGGSELVENDYMVPYEDEVEIIYTAAQRDYMERNNSRMEKYNNIYYGREI